MCKLGLDLYKSYLERELLRYCEGGRKVTFTRTFLMLGKVTFGEHVNIFEVKVL